jgi:uncharacterized membrane protein (UPF0127 family)
MKSRLPLVIASLALLLAGTFYLAAPRLHAGATPSAVTTQPTASVTIDLAKQPFKLLIAHTDDEREFGLMNVTHLPNNTGMIFIFQSDELLSFWMKNTLIPLDLIYLDSTGTVTAIATMQTEPGVSDDRLRRYDSPSPVRYAIEINAGVCATLPLHVGDVVHLPDQVVKLSAK